MKYMKRNLFLLFLELRISNVKPETVCYDCNTSGEAYVYQKIFMRETF